MPAIDSLPNFSGFTIDQGRYLLLDYLGCGGYGKVYRALDSTSPADDPKYYAVKCLAQPEPGSYQAECLELELTLHQAINHHPNIATFRKVVCDSDFVYVVLDLYEGGDLFSWITERKMFLGNDHLIKTTFLRILDAVEYCHKNKIFHRDLKPENILTSKDGSQVFLSDFGLATKSRVSSEYGCGSSYYMSPECRNKSLTNGKFSTLHCDIWSLGVILVNLITARMPWRKASMDDEGFAAFLHDPHYLRDVLPISREANQILLGIFHINPLSRPSLSKIRSAIETLDTFYMSDRELASASPYVRMVINSDDGNISDYQLSNEQPPHSAYTPSPQTSLDAEEQFLFPPVDENAPLPKFTPLPNTLGALELGLYVVQNTSGESDDSSDDDSAGPITPESRPVVPTGADAEVQCLPEGDDLGQPAISHSKTFGWNYALDNVLQVPPRARAHDCV